MKTIYHPAFQVAYYLQCLPKELSQQIPRTTKFDWNNKNVQHSFGYDWYNFWRRSSEGRPVSIGTVGLRPQQES